LRKDRDDILYRETSPTEGSRAENLARVRLLAPAALARFGVQSDRSPAAAVQALQRETGKIATDAVLLNQVVEGCYEVLLAWAEVEAQSGTLPGRPTGDREKSARQAIHLLDVAAAVGQAYQAPTPQTYHLRRARYLRQAGDKVGAAREASAIRTGPTTALDHFLAGLEEYRNDRIAPAAKACRLALDRQPGHYWAQYLLALCQLKIKCWSEAAAGFTACLGRQPDDFWPALMRGVAHAGQGAAHAERKELGGSQPGEAWRLHGLSEPGRSVPADQRPQRRRCPDDPGADATPRRRAAVLHSGPGLFVVERIGVGAA
jgi:hypothetical protein